VGAVPFMEAERGAIGTIDDFKDSLCIQPRYGALTCVYQTDIQSCSVSRIELCPRRLKFYPTSLINHEVVAKIAPLEISEDCVCDRSDDSESLQYSPPVQPHYFFDTPFPPWRGVLAGLLGAAGVLWGFKNDRRLPWSFLTFVAGIFLFAYACLATLPWLADQRF